MARGAQKELKVAEKGLNLKVGELKPPQPQAGSYGSDDIAEVSWNVPTVNLRYPGNIPGLPAHHWAGGIAMATPIAHKGATAGVAAHALTALDLLTKPELLQSARKYFAEQTKTVQWQSLIPPGTEPPVYLNRDKMERVRPQLEKLRYDPSRYATYLEQLGVKYPTLR
jgi:aminobenzoyl-glutamate utilization protein B